MRKFLETNLVLGLLSLVLGVIAVVLITVYLWFFPIDKSEYNMYVYYINNNKRAEQTDLSKDIENVFYLIEYYGERNIKPVEESTIDSDDGSFFLIPLNSKVKVLDTIGSYIVKIELLYYHKNGDIQTRKGYIPLINLHSESRTEYRLRQPPPLQHTNE